MSNKLFPIKFVKSKKTFPNIYCCLYSFFALLARLAFLWFLHFPKTHRTRMIRVFCSYFLCIASVDWCISSYVCQNVQVTSVQWHWIKLFHMRRCEYCTSSHSLFPFPMSLLFSFLSPVRERTRYLLRIGGSQRTCFELFECFRSLSIFQELLGFVWGFLYIFLVPHSGLFHRTSYRLSSSGLFPVATHLGNSRVMSLARMFNLAIGNGVFGRV